MADLDDIDLSNISPSILALVAQVNASLADKAGRVKWVLPMLEKIANSKSTSAVEAQRAQILAEFAVQGDLAAVATMRRAMPNREKSPDAYNAAVRLREAIRAVDEAYEGYLIATYSADRPYAVADTQARRQRYQAASDLVDRMLAVTG